MSLLFPSSERRLLHRRGISVQVFARADGYFDVEAELQDCKTRDLPMHTGVRPAGVPIHDMLLRLVVDSELNILAADSASPWTPYPGYCDKHGAAYERLVGLNLMRGFRAAVKERLGGVLGCTHLTELSQVLPTAVLQAFSGEVIDAHEGRANGQPPYQIDRCQALKSAGEVVLIHYPRWYRGASASAKVSGLPVSHPDYLSSETSL